ncbi:MAG: YiiD C-terminal domain-containing protein [Trueperaceae bacterium]|nr:YiiD C-terminal domain-containing protein [Trueperaceae bacterium]
MDESRIEAFLHRHLPLARAMEVRVVRVDEDGARLTAPLAQNHNHHGTAFGGSLSALAMLAGWAFVHAALERAGIEGAEVVIHEVRFAFTKPARGDLEAWVAAPEDAAWDVFARALARRGRARLDLGCELRSEDAQVARAEGRYVAVRGGS